jgi:hypothetical protein
MLIEIEIPKVIILVLNVKHIKEKLVLKKYGVKYIL